VPFFVIFLRRIKRRENSKNCSCAAGDGGCWTYEGGSRREEREEGGEEEGKGKDEDRRKEEKEEWRKRSK
jgi:hypothetical protein